MLRWLLNTFSTWALVPIVIGPPVLFAAGGLYLVRRRGTHVLEDQSEATGG